MKTIAALMILSLVAAEPFPESWKTKTDGSKQEPKLGYRKFHHDMVSGDEAHGSRGWATADPNWSDDGYTGPHNQRWNVAKAKKAYWSYDTGAGDNGMKAHNHVRKFDTVNSNDDAAEAADGTDAKLWEAYMKKERFFGMYGKVEGATNDGKEYYESPEIKGGNTDHRLANLDEHDTTYMLPKNHLSLFAQDSELCAPSVARRKTKDADGNDTEQDDHTEGGIIAGLRGKHDSGHSKYQGCTLDNCALTVMYACSFMCNSCTARWCEAECQKRKENMGSCIAAWNSIDEGGKCATDGIISESAEGEPRGTLQDTAVSE